ncbi:MAG: hypothetical protein FJ399_21855 [Verrucomicrobia bacterium]|nr:hypothetical protein [Verrucomicrobiota bacterium]
MRLAPSIALLALTGVTAMLRGADPAPASFARVEVAPTWTSVYVGTVSLTIPTLVRNASGDYEAAYAARVFPYFFYNEQGRIAIRVSDESLGRLARGETIEFTGRAINTMSEVRQVEGKATPVEATRGRIKVRVRVSPRIELIFNTTYHFPTE